jgi:hypothetical protein
MKLRGNDMALMVDKDGEWRSIAYATTCEIDIQARMVEVGSPMTGRWRKMKKRGQQWVGSTGHLMADKKEEADIMEMVKERRAVMVCFGTVKRVDGMVELTEKGEMTGEAYVASARVSARKGDMVTISAEIVGIGTLAALWDKWILEDGRWNMHGVWINSGRWIM